jgi:hypothetical protein
MILKLQLNREQFADLADFLASEANERRLLKELLPEAGIPFFYGEETDDRFASILKTAPSKDGKLDVSLLIQEKYMVTSEDLRPTPHRYLDALFEAMQLFPITRTFVVSRVLDCDAPPRVPKAMEFLTIKGKGAVHQRMGQVLLEKRIDGRLYADGVEVLLRPLSRDFAKEADNSSEVRLLNACFLAELWRNPALVPSEWAKAGTIFFRGTIFSADHGSNGQFVSLYLGGLSLSTSGCSYHNGCLRGDNWGSSPCHEAVLPL